MRKIFKLIIITILSISPAMSSGQDYKDMWKQVESAIEQDLPATALIQLNKIYDEAHKTNDVPQMLKSLINIMGVRELTDSDKQPVDRARFLSLVEKADNKADKAVAMMMLASYDMEDKYETAIGEMTTALSSPEFLASIPSDKYKPLIKEGADSRIYFGDNLYHLLARTAISNLQQNIWKEDDAAKGIERIERIYKTITAIYKDNVEARLLTLMDYDMFIKETMTDPGISSHLEEWIAQYPETPVMPIMLYRLAEQYNQEKKYDDELVCLKKIQDKYPKFRQLKNVRALIAEVLDTEMSMNIQTPAGDKPLKTELWYRNLKNIKISVYRLNAPVNTNFTGEAPERTIRRCGSLVSTRDYQLDNVTGRKGTTTNIEIPNPGPGMYMIYTEGGGKTSGDIIYVTRLRIFATTLPGNIHRAVVVNAATGLPEEGATVEIYDRRGIKLIQKLTTDKNGEVLLPSTSCEIRAIKGDDHYMPTIFSWNNSYRPSQPSRKEETVELFTDRGIYRPGQTIQLTGVAYKRNGDKFNVLRSEEITLTLVSLDGEAKEERKVKTDKSGTIHASFKLPSDSKTGIWQITSDKYDAFTTISVEEYKRPTFEIASSDDAKYRDGHFTASGTVHYFSGENLDGAKVRYTLTAGSPWRYWGPTYKIGTGETISSSGRWAVDHTIDAKYTKMLSEGHPMVIRMLVEITSPAGETHSEESCIPAGEDKLALRISGLESDYIANLGRTITLNAADAAGRPVSVEASYNVKRSSDNKTMLEGTATTNTPIRLTSLDKLPSGEYTIQISAQNENGTKSEAKEKFLLFSLTDKRLPGKKEKWTYTPNDEFDITRPAELYIGTSYKDVWLIMNIMTADKLIETRHIRISDEIKKFTFNYQKTYGDGLTISWAFMKDGKLYEDSQKYKLTLPNKKLIYKWETFRDKLTPGAEEKWRLRILNPDGTPAAGITLTAFMYDASLDKITNYNPVLSPKLERNLADASWKNYQHSGSYLNFSSENIWYDGIKLRLTEFDYILWHKFMRESRSFGNRQLGMVCGIKPALENAHVEMSNNKMSDEALDEEKPVEVRENFAETAFFYPAIHTDKEGYADIDFTLPETLTRWKFIALAHSDDMNCVTVEATAEACKEFSLRLNSPRFLRQGDKNEIPVTISSQRYELTEGTVKFRACDPVEGKTYYEGEKKFAAAPGKSQTIHFDFTLDKSPARLIIEVEAKSADFADGEKISLPVLSEKEKLSQTLPLFTEAGQSRKYNLENIFNNASKTASDKHLEATLTAHPVWYAVRALASLSGNNGESIVDKASVLYASSLALHIAEGNEAVRGEFDLPALRIRRQSSLSQLRSAQLRNGAWSWFEGMSASRLITTAVMDMNSRVAYITGEENDAAMNSRALAYLADEAYREYDDALRNEAKNKKYRWTPSDETLSYIQICDNLGRRPQGDKYRVMEEEVISRLSKLNRGLTIYGKAAGALILQNHGREKQAHRLIKSLREYSVFKEGFGRYYDTPKAVYSWRGYKIPTQVAAMQTLRREGGYEKELAQMSLWLLRQKQAQEWSDPLSTADAVYALMTCSGSLVRDRGDVTLTIGGETLSTDSRKDAAGFAHKTFTPASTAVMASNSMSASWGTITATYREDIRNVEPHSGALSIKRSLYRDGRQIEKNQTRAGDRITIRLDISSDRDMDYVNVTDRRSADMEPVDQHSGLRWHNLLYYMSIKDASTSFHIEKMPKGRYTIEYDVYITLDGSYLMGIPVIESEYCDEFKANGK